MNPEQKAQIQSYITQMRMLGYDKYIIAQSLMRSGWQEWQIDPILNPPFEEKVTKKSKFSQLIDKVMHSQIFVLVSVAIITILFMVGAYLLLVRPQSVIMIDFSDTNFSLRIPDDWQQDIGYKPGDAVINFYSPEGNNPATRQQAAKLSVYVDSSANRINNQLGTLNPSNYTVISDKQGSNNAAKYRLTEVNIGSPSDSPNNQHLITITLEGNQRVVSADITVEEQYWEQYSSYAEDILTSIIPKVPSN